MATDERIENLEKGLDRVKRRNRWVLAVVILTIVSLQAGLFDPAPPKVKRTKQDVSLQAAKRTYELLSTPTAQMQPPEPPITAREMWDRNMTRVIPVIGKLNEWYDIHKMKSIIDKAAVGEASKMEQRELEVYLGWQVEIYNRGTTYHADLVEFIIGICPWAMLCLGGWALIHHMQKRQLV